MASSPIMGWHQECPPQKTFVKRHGGTSTAFTISSSSLYLSWFSLKPFLSIPSLLSILFLFFFHIASLTPSHMQVLCVLLYPSIRGMLTVGTYCYNSLPNIHWVSSICYIHTQHFTCNTPFHLYTKKILLYLLYRQANQGETWFSVLFDWIPWHMLITCPLYVSAPGTALNICVQQHPKHAH